ncbi:hypothetical protein SY83_12895 [Paenibacillus swuensis]|uniref:M23ase beta-sheet core domain-containing protein n=1 Tax=Paenibacillus swuensis TaxID=1178515 RepID=A0A172TJJ7_9BACL|nr:M23 family metallopeptidase [Paenibacillus swuensis]ANE47017.1 hypothetical protein SY83_12895 [Paenibacillus swuensis]
MFGKHKRKFTLLIIPEPERSVMHFRLSKWLIFTLPLLGVSALTYIFLTMHYDASHTQSKLESDLRQQSHQFTRTVIDKNSDIEQLQSEVIRLSRQANQVSKQLGRLQELEVEINGFLGNGKESSSRSASAKNAKPSAESETISSAAGGEWLPPSNEEMIALSTTLNAKYDSLNTLLSTMQKNLAETLAKAREAQHKLAVTPTLWPTTSRTVTSLFGYRSDPFHHRPSFHRGLDIAGDTGDKVFAAADGTVEVSDSDGQHGQYIVLGHTSRISTSYLHLSKRMVKPGQHVTKGTVIGLLGSTGRSTGPHLHFEIHRDGKEINPQLYIKPMGKDVSYVWENED